MWRTDGTTEGTIMLADTIVGSKGGVTFFCYPADADGTLYFVATSEIWSSSGTPETTRRVAGPFPGAAPEALTYAAGLVFFAANTSETELRELWRTDGTEEGTYIAKEILPGPFGSMYFDEMIGAGVNCALTCAIDETHGYELWASDGTEEGTYLVSDLNPDSISANPWRLCGLNGAICFSAGDLETGTELYVTDGTSQGTRALGDQFEGPDGIGWGSISPNLYPIVRTDTEFFYTFDDGIHGPELWASDGTESGTRMVKDLLQGSAHGRPYNVTPLGNEVLFSLWRDKGLWTSDGTESGTLSIYSQEGMDPRNLMRVGPLVYFSGNGTSRDYELWRTDGRESGTYLVADLRSGSSSDPFPVGSIGDDYIFTADDGVHGRELWRSGGTLETTALIADIMPGSATSAIESACAVGDRVFFSANDGTHGRELWATDGSPDGTYLVMDIQAGGESSRPEYPSRFGEIVIFSASDPEHGRELWRSDGTPEGTFLLKDINPGTQGSISYLSVHSVATSDWFYFAAFSDGTGQELWRTRGTASSTMLVADLADGPSSSVPTSFAAIGEDVYFAAWTADVGNELRVHRAWRRGDLNCDDSVDFDDVDGMVCALVGESEYQQQYPQCDIWGADVNRDGTIDFNDIDGFVECLIHDGCP